MNPRPRYRETTFFYMIRIFDQTVVVVVEWSTYGLMTARSRVQSKLPSIFQWDAATLNSLVSAHQ